MEIRRPDEIPFPLINYIYLIINKKPPYYDIIRHIVKEMELRYQQTGKSEIVYTINPRMLSEEIKTLVQNEEKLTSRNICLTLLALCHLCKLREEKDFYVTTTSSGRPNYHFKVNQKILNSFSRIL